MSEHTQGPWEARGENGKYRITDWDVVNDSLSYYATVPVHRNGYVVAMVVDGDGDDELLDANARLISAAPELLEALESVLDSLGALTKQHELLDRMDESEANKVWAALYKATGRPVL